MSSISRKDFKPCLITSPAFFRLFSTSPTFWKVNYLTFSHSCIYTSPLQVIKLSKSSPSHLIVCGCHFNFVSNHLIFRDSKTDQRLETRIERPEPVPDPTSKIGSPESGPEIQIDLNRIIPDPKFSTKLLIFAWQSYWTKIGWPKVDPNWSSLDPTQNVT